MKTRLTPYMASNLLAGHSWLFITIQAVAAILLGAVFLIAPRVALVTLAILTGIMLGACGIERLVLMALTRKVRWWNGLLGVALIAAGVFMLLDPLLGVLELMWLLGAMFLLHGVELTIAAAQSRFRKSFRLLTAFNALLSLLCGVAIFAFPLAGFAIIDFLFAFYLILYGIVTLILGIRLYDIGKQSKK
ncbi:MAG: DUF308 domain-containing protein [Victivallaceae bacterium]|nr:DUF308 domain-containing protein [Victivallaceae bacterium]